MDGTVAGGLQVRASSGGEGTVSHARRWGRYSIKDLLWPSESSLDMSCPSPLRQLPGLAKQRAVIWLKWRITSIAPLVFRWTPGADTAPMAHSPRDCPGSEVEAALLQTVCMPCRSTITPAFLQARREPRAVNTYRSPRS